MAAGGRFREVMKKYGKVALGVHLSISAASLAGLYVAVKSNVDVKSIFNKYGLEKYGLETLSPKEEENVFRVPIFSYRTTEMAASVGGAIVLANACNRALIPVRIPITIVLTHPIARFLTRRRLIK